MPSRIINRLGRDQRGITGLETAIILIAFVVVASVFAYTVLSAGVFSSQKGKEAVHAGLSTARSSMEVVGSVKATSVAAVTLDNADTAWSVSANATSSLDTSDRKEGTASNDLTIDAAFTTGLAAYSDISSTDISSHFSARLWVKSSINTVAGDLSLVIDEATGCSGPEETLSLPALTANTWKQVLLK
ncbi:MAG: archaellin/type IV pilin N-terminal domain-containing protein, partial [Dehalococcoidia bacterium]